jgi:hypothetical protein
MIRRIVDILHTSEGKLRMHSGGDGRFVSL